MPAKHHLFSVTLWLLKAAQLFVAFVMGVLGLALGGMVVALVDSNHLGIPAMLEGVARNSALELGGFAVACGLICIALAFFALRAAQQIVDSAIAGDPFVSLNAARLARIGWLLLTAELVGYVANPIFFHIVSQVVPPSLRHDANIHFDGIGFGLSPIGVLAVLLIFVLAQIFRHGSEMREELASMV